MMISLVIPVYNCEKYLNICIESVLAQEYNDWEAVLVDDGSTDGSSSICDALAQKDKRIRVVHTDNHGASHARNVGLDIAKGEFIMFLDSDDYICSHYLSSFISHSNVDLVVGGYSTFGLVKMQKTLSEEYFKSLGNWDKVDVPVNNPRINAIYHICGKMYKKSVIKESFLRFPENMKLAEDTCFNIQYLQKCQDLCFISESGYFYRIYNVYNRYVLNYAEYYRHVRLFQKYCDTFYINTGFNFENIKNSILMSFLMAFNNHAANAYSYIGFIDLSRFLRRQMLLPTNQKIILKKRDRILYCAYTNPYWGGVYVKIDNWIYSIYISMKQIFCQHKSIQF